MTNTTTMNPYVGTANTIPDSRTPRRFMTASSATKPTAIGTACGARPGNADTMLATPAATDTATVST